MLCSAQEWGSEIYRSNDVNFQVIPQFIKAASLLFDWLIVIRALTVIALVVKRQPHEFISRFSSLPDR
jgi:hypothetical protein